MITDSELRISNKSYTKKDFYQIYPEILDLASKLSDIWDPASSNESDPGVVLLKLLAFIADKTNYNIDKEALEAFMASATQEDSMRKLCDMMGYDMHYYRSAETKVSFMWTGDYLSTSVGKAQINIPRFTSITNDAQDVNYILTDPVTLSYRGQVETKDAIEGSLNDISINGSYLVKLVNLDDRNRYYLPETQIAENGIWIWNSSNDSADINENDIIDFWSRVTNLNIQEPNKHVWKFGYDSRKKLPYIQFPDDINALIGDGLRIRYVRTKGFNGNISAKVLTSLSGITKLKGKNSEGVIDEEIELNDGDKSNLIITNSSYTYSGKNVETIDDAFNGFKKTVGTFDTLVTCRDYANKIYNLVYSEKNTKNLVSNVQVTDITSDINFSNKIVTFNDFGVVYEDVPEMESYIKVTELPEPSSTNENNVYLYNDKFYRVIEIGTNTYGFVSVSKSELQKINNFDLYIYPLNSVESLNTDKNYKTTFKPDRVTIPEIKNQLADIKTISHNIKQISAYETHEGALDNIYLIKNKYRLSAKISTTYKVNKLEGQEILANIYGALYKNFNSRNLDYGQEIPFDLLQSTIEQADSRIKFVALEEPELTSYVMFGDGEEEKLSPAPAAASALGVYEVIAVKNVLAGRLPLFDYDNRMKYEIGDIAPEDAEYDRLFGAKRVYPTEIPVPVEQLSNPLSLTWMDSNLNIYCSNIDTFGYTLKKNESVQLIAPSITDGDIYPAYVNYFFDYGSYRNEHSGESDTACQVVNVYNPNDTSEYTETKLIEIWETNKTDVSKLSEVFTVLEITSSSDLATQRANLAGSTPKRNIYKLDPAATSLSSAVKVTSDTYEQNMIYLAVNLLNDSNWSMFTDQTQKWFLAQGWSSDNWTGILKKDSTSTKYQPGYLIDDTKTSYKIIYNYTKNNLYVSKVKGDSAVSENMFIPANTEYKLKAGDILYLNYTDSDSIIHNIRLTNLEATDNGVRLEDYTGIIKANMDLYDSAAYNQLPTGKSYSKTTGYSFSEVNLPGMLSLKGTEQISMRKFVKADLQPTTLKCYWLTKNGDLTFNRIGDTNKYEYILDNDEYFFYTDEMEHSLATLSSGTSLILEFLTSTAHGSTVTWVLSQNEDFNLDEVADKGIGAFSEQDWNIQRLGDKAILHIQENTIINLAEDDVIKNVEVEGDNILTNEWKKLTSTSVSKFTYNGTKLSTYDFEDSSITWRIRSCLNINIGPEVIQELKNETTSLGNTLKEQNIVVYTSYWTDPNDLQTLNSDTPIVVSDDTDLSLMEEHKVETPIETFTDVMLKSNYLIQKAGGNNISLHRYSLDGIEKDDFIIYPFNRENIEVTDRNDAVSTFNDNQSSKSEYSKIGFAKYKKLSLPLYIPKENGSASKSPFGLLMVYYTTSIETLPENYITVTAHDVRDATQTVNTLSLYKDNYDDTGVKEYEMTLKPGINVLRINSGCTLDFDFTSDALGSLVFSNLSVINGTVDNGKTGVDYKLLNINPEQCVNFVRLLNSKFGADKFYYNVPVNINKQIDTTILDEYSLFNYNNIANNFVLSELDTDFSDIQIAKSSKVTRW